MSGKSVVDLTKIKPIGDSVGDGQMCLTFSLPIPYGLEGTEAARQLALRLGFDEPNVARSEDLGCGYSFYVVYCKCKADIDFTQIKVSKVDVETMDKYAVEAYIKENIKRNIVVVGACTGSDAHTVGIDAILNMKGFAGHYGLERYKGIEVYNMGSQVPNEELVKKAVEVKADAILVSQIVTQRDGHIANLSALAEILDAEEIRGKVVLACGGPRISHDLAQELGYDAGFGAGTFAEDVATFIVTEMVKRNLARG